MKIIKNNKRLVEDVEDEVLGSVSTDEIAADIEAGAEEADLHIDEDDADKEAEIVKNLASIIRNPYGTGRLSQVEQVLQDSLDRKSTRLNSSHDDISRMPSSA